MSEFIYELITSEFGGENIKRTDEDGNEAWIPVDQNNADYQRYLEQLEESE
jgi:hypothetical protein